MEKNAVVDMLILLCEEEEKLAVGNDKGKNKISELAKKTKTKMPLEQMVSII